MPRKKGPRSRPPEAPPEPPPHPAVAEPPPPPPPVVAGRVSLDVARLRTPTSDPDCPATPADATADSATSADDAPEQPGAAISSDNDGAGPPDLESTSSAAPTAEVEGNSSSSTTTSTTAEEKPASELKDEGNALFKGGDFLSAREMYARALDVLGDEEARPLRATVLCNAAAAALSHAREKARTTRAGLAEILTEAYERAVGALEVADAIPLRLKAIARKAEAAFAYARLAFDKREIFVFDAARKLGDRELVNAEDPVPVMKGAGKFTSLATLRRELCEVVARDLADDSKHASSLRLRVARMLATLWPPRARAPWFREAETLIRAKDGISIAVRTQFEAAAWFHVVQRFAALATLLAQDSNLPNPNANLDDDVRALADGLPGNPAVPPKILALVRRCALTDDEDLPKKVVSALVTRGRAVVADRVPGDDFSVVADVWSASFDALVDVAAAGFESRGVDPARVRGGMIDFMLAQGMIEVPTTTSPASASDWEDVFTGFQTGLFVSLLARNDHLVDVFGPDSLVRCFEGLRLARLKAATRVGNDDKARAAAWLLGSDDAPPNMLRLLRRRYGHIPFLNSLHPSHFASAVRLYIHRVVSPDRLRLLPDWNAAHKAGFFAMVSFSMDMESSETSPQMARLTWENFVMDESARLPFGLHADDVEEEEGEDDDDYAQEEEVDAEEDDEEDDVEEEYEEDDVEEEKEDDDDDENAEKNTYYLFFSGGRA